MAIKHVTREQSVSLEVECCVCGMIIAMSEEQEVKFRQKGTSFYCVLGHIQSFTKSENTRLREELTKAQESNNSLSAQRQTLLLEKSILERKLDDAAKEKSNLVKRVNAGVCPHCQRTVSQMARHIKTKHGDMPALATTPNT